MIKLCDAKDCTGCMACGNACRFGAITFSPDNEGFLHPKIDPERCTGCKMCVRACPILTPCPPAGTQEEKRVFAAWAKDENIRDESSSGGVFSVLAKDVIAAGGVVFGAAFDERFSVRHVMAEDEDGLKNLRGSKYVQSDIGKTFSLAENFLKARRRVFFTGTPCQIAGLRMYLRKDYENLLTADIVCHGVPSPMVFESYKIWLESRLGSPLGDYKFRDKRWSWKYFNTKAPHLGREKTENFSGRGRRIRGCADFCANIFCAKDAIPADSRTRTAPATLRSPIIGATVPKRESSRTTTKASRWSCSIIPKGGMPSRG